MSDIQRDREEREKVIEVLKNMLDWMEAANMISSKPERIEAIKYAIASIKTDLKYDLLYEETSGQADKPTTKNDLGVDKARSDSELIARGDVLNTIKETAQYHTGDSFNADRLIRYIKELPSVTPQEPRWISCSERLPEYGEEVLTCSNVDRFIEIQSLKNSYGGYWENQRGDWCDLDEIVAWMPLPKPFEPQESEDKE